MPINQPIKVLSVDDHPLIRDGIHFAIQAQPDMLLVAEAANGQEAVELFRQHRPDVTLMDLNMPVMNGIDATLQIKEISPKSRVLVLTTYSGDMQAARALQAGADGYLLKGSLRKELVQAIRDVHNGRRRIQSEIAQNLAEHIDSDRLSEREVEVLRCVADGCSNKIVADNLGISEETVKGHMKNIMSKLEANDRTHAVFIALQRGFFDAASTR
ncbi:MAG TPA: response regulator transcription factor [Acidobacteriaceae bacterium]|jgi:DNA-binding NarL/FixJ family response regulator|nr:response regulator transcription factor [Acidobacteriaceae bacterium]